MTALQAMHAHLLVLLDLNVHLGGRVREGAAAVGFPEEVRFSHLQEQQCFSKAEAEVHLHDHRSKGLLSEQSSASSLSGEQLQGKAQAACSDYLGCLVAVVCNGCMKV